MRPWLATSCLQGRPLAQAMAELAALDPGGLQLCPGNLPSPAASSPLPQQTHHGFDPKRRRSRVWRFERELRLLAASDSVHPPRTRDCPWDAFVRWVEAHPEATVLETMYPGYHLGTGRELWWAMDRALPLAVDVSHLFLQRAAGALDDATLARLWGYDRVVEVHVSANDGRSDQHRLLRPDTFGLAWARERLAAGTVVVVEAYLHRASPTEREAQLAWAYGEASPAA